MNHTNPVVRQLIDSAKPGLSLPAEFYSDSNVYRADLEAIFFRHWIYAGHCSQLAEPGNFFLLEFGDESFIVVRDHDLQIRAFANVCRHRGSRVCLKRRGKVRSFVCPYHAWTYELDGRLRSRRAMPTDFKQQDYGLKPIRVGEFHGLIFVNLCAEATDLESVLNPMHDSFQIYGLQHTKVAHQQTFSVGANWKLAIENFMECYHCAPAHPEYACSHALKSPKDYESLRPAMLERAAQIGYRTETIDSSSPAGSSSTPFYYNRSALYDPYVTGSENGKPVAPLLGELEEFGGGAADIQIGPASYAILYPDHAVWYRFLPTAVQQTDMEIIWLVKNSAVEGVDYKLDDLVWLWTVTTKADKEIILNNQKGVNSKFYQPGPFSEMEVYTSGFIEWYLDQLQS